MANLISIKNELPSQSASVPLIVHDKIRVGEVCVKWLVDWWVKKDVSNKIIQLLLYLLPNTHTSLQPYTSAPPLIPGHPKPTPSPILTRILQSI